MRKIIFLTILMAVPLISAAQQDECCLQITYEQHYKRYEEDSVLSKDISRLDIGKHSSRFYSLPLEWYKQHSKGRHPYSGAKPKKDEVYKSMPTSGLMTSIHMPFWITVQDSIDNLFEWKLEDGDSTICGYPCHKARTAFRGRTWTAWYTMDIPYNDGPWKLCGLPGTILYAEDAERKFIFNCINIEMGDGHVFAYPSFAGKRIVSPAQAEKYLMLEAEDNDAFFAMLMPGARITNRTDANGRSYKWEPRTAVTYEMFPQNHKKKQLQKKKK